MDNLPAMSHPIPIGRERSNRLESPPGIEEDDKCRDRQQCRKEISSERKFHNMCQHPNGGWRAFAPDVAVEEYEVGTRQRSLARSDDLLFPHLHAARTAGRGRETGGHG